MDHSKFIKMVENSGQISGSFWIFTDEVIKRWLDDNRWIENPKSPCLHCKHLHDIGEGFSEERCRQNVKRGGACYRETLKKHLIPCLRRALKGTYPSMEKLMRVIHKKGPIWDGIPDNFCLLSAILDALGGTAMRMATEAKLKK